MHVQVYEHDAIRHRKPDFLKPRKDKWTPICQYVIRTLSKWQIMLISTKHINEPYASASEEQMVEVLGGDGLWSIDSPPQIIRPCQHNTTINTPVLDFSATEVIGDFKTSMSEIQHHNFLKNYNI